jgi:tetratricopeptide (TPR) repeat protein
MRLVPALLLASVFAATTAAAPQQGLTAAPQISRVYDAIFDGRFDEVPAMAAQTCPPAPTEVCQLLDVVSLWWQIQLDPNNTSRDAAFEARADAAVDAVSAWTGREPTRAEAWFYLGGAYGARAQWRVLRGQRLAAARDGKRIKDALEQALRLDPSLQDAWFGIGLYHYYADVAPTAAKILRFLLLLPGGDRVEGMQEMLRARNGGQILRDEADYQLQIVYLWYEKDPQRALELLHGLRDRHPRNPIFQQSIADVEDVYMHDLTASLRSWQALLDAARAGDVVDAAAAETRARLGVALQLDRLYETDAALEPLRAVIAAHPAAPFEAVAQAQLQLGLALDRLGDRSGAEAAYHAAIAAASEADPLKVADQARRGLRTRPNPDGALAYRLSIEGWRALQRRALADAARALTRSLDLRPNDQVTRYRQARLLLAEKKDDEALMIYEAIVREHAATPPVFYANACVDAARLYEQRHEPARAIDLYTLARTTFGADQRTKDEAQRALARLTAPPRDARTVGGRPVGRRR